MCIFGNFLFHKGEFSGYIDFDLSQCNIRIFDICYFLVGLLTKEVNPEMNHQQWMCAVTDVIKGYDQIIELTRKEKEAVPYVMESIELLFTAWSLQIRNEACAEDAGVIYHKICNCFTT